MKKILEQLILTSCIMCGAVSLGSCGTNNGTIAVVKLGAHTSLDEIETAIVNELNSNAKGYKVKTYDCSFDGDIITQTVTGLKDQDVKCVIPIATPVAQVAANAYANSDVPIIFAAVSDPVAANLVKDLNNPEGNVTGTSDAIQMGALVDKAIAIDSSLSKVGFIYNPNEDNSVSAKALLESYCSSKNIEVISKTISASSEMTEVANSLVGKVGAFIENTDNTVASAMNTLGTIARNSKIPCYVGADSMVSDGGMLCVGINYTVLGTYTASMAIKAINGTAIKDIPVKVFNDDLNIYLNTDYVSKANITVPAAILNDAKLIKYTDGCLKSD